MITSAGANKLARAGPSSPGGWRWSSIRPTPVCFIPFFQLASAFCSFVSSWSGLGQWLGGWSWVEMGSRLPGQHLEPRGKPWSWWLGCQPVPLAAPGGHTHHFLLQKAIIKIIKCIRLPI